MSVLGKLLCLCSATYFVYMCAVPNGAVLAIWVERVLHSSEWQPAHACQAVRPALQLHLSLFVVWYSRMLEGSADQCSALLHTDAY